MIRQTLKARRPKRRREDGASVVESALVLPLFVLLIFSIIEAGSMFLNFSAVRTASREGAREASAAASSSTADQTALIASMRSLGQLSGSLEGVIIFKAENVSSKVPQACLDALDAGLPGVKTAVPPVQCNVYNATKVRNPEITKFGASSSNGDPAVWDSYWAPIDRIEVLTPTSSPDYVGVFVKVKSAGATGLLPKRAMTAVNIFQLEPQRAQE
jgi:Flp pilus assembly protein TadG